MKNEIIEEWFERARRNFETAKLVFPHGGYYDEVLLLLHQAVEKYLKGYLICHGWELKKIHDIYILLLESTKHNDSFKKFLNLGKKLISFYYEERYPAGPPPEIAKEEAKEIFCKEFPSYKLLAEEAFEKSFGKKLTVEYEADQNEIKPSEKEGFHLHCWDDEKIYYWDEEKEYCISDDKEIYDKLLEISIKHFEKHKGSKR